MKLEWFDGFPTGELPGPGIYKNVPAEAYHALPYCHSGGLRALNTGAPAHIEYARKHPEEPTDALRIGAAFHTFVLEPHLFADAHPVAGPCAARTGKGDFCTNPGKVPSSVGDWLCGVHGKGRPPAPGGTLTTPEFELISSMADALRVQPMAARLLADKTGWNELTIIWDRKVVLSDGSTYLLRCKLRADMLRPLFGICADIKSAKDGSRDGFERAVTQEGYHIQASHYMDGIAAAGIEGVDHYVFLTQEKTEPFLPAARRLGDASLNGGRIESEPLYRQWAECEKSGKWPGYSDDIEDVELAPWKLKQLGI